jgi:Rrf2 family protein
MLTYMAMEEGDAPVSRASIAQAEDVTVDYAEQILIKLKAGNLVQSHRGAHGGYTFQKDPAEITVAHVVALLEGEAGLAPCLSCDCSRLTTCAVADVWKAASGAFSRELEAVTIQDLACKTRRMIESQAVQYVI